MDCQRRAGEKKSGKMGAPIVKHHLRDGNGFRPGESEPRPTSFTVRRPLGAAVATILPVDEEVALQDTVNRGGGRRAGGEG